MKKLFYGILSILVVLFIAIFNLFFKINSDINHIIGINIIIILNIFISIFCIIFINRIFKKNNLKNGLDFKKNIKLSTANSFFVSSIISIFLAIIVYQFLNSILEFLKLKNGLINYTVFASKIWFISAPFIGLELTIFRYFFEINYFKTPIKILILKLFVFLGLGMIFYIKYKTNCLIYAKPVCDMIFLPYYTKTCFDLTLKIKD